MSSTEAPPRQAPVFSPKVILGVILVGVVSFSALAVLSAYAPDLKTGSDGGAHALSKSADGFAGAAVLLQARGVRTVISRSPPGAGESNSVLILTPGFGARAEDLAAFGWRRPTLVVLPKWATAPDPRRAGWVRKLGAPLKGKALDGLLKDLSKSTDVTHSKGVTQPRLQGRGDPFSAQTSLPLGRIDQLQTIAGPGLRPVLVDEQGRIVLAATARKGVFVLADPDLLNTQGLRSLDNARAATAIVDALGGAERGVAFDVALNGFQRGRNLARTLLEPPLLGATLCALAAALLAGLHALVRFGPAARHGRAVALGKTALVDNSAALVRMARKEPMLLPTYAELTQSLAAKAAGGHAGLAVESRTSWLSKLARLRGSNTNLEELVEEAGRAKARGDTLSAARKLHHWRLEVTRERE